MKYHRSEGCRRWRPRNRRKHYVYCSQTGQAFAAIYHILGALFRAAGVAAFRIRTFLAQLDRVAAAARGPDRRHGNRLLMPQRIAPAPRSFAASRREHAIALPCHGVELGPPPFDAGGDETPDEPRGGGRRYLAEATCRSTGLPFLVAVRGREALEPRPGGVLQGIAP